ncbi:MAG: DUF4443 domain-containing protein [Candidatus Woesearchaeota archaeon]
MVGNPPKFNKYDVLRCLLGIQKDISRLDLGRLLELGEGTVRTILDILKIKRLIDSDRQGHTLTAKGKQTKENLAAEFEFIEIAKTKELGGKHTFAFKIRNERRLEVGYKQRDIAIKNGAEGALLMVYDKGLRMPGISRFDVQLYSSIFELTDYDILVVCSAATRRMAEWAGIAVAESLNGKVKRILKMF